MSVKNEQSPASLEVEMKIGILHTIAKSIYSDPKLKIREAVANSMDNKASWFVIYADRPSRTISLLDNGNGISKERFIEIFKSIGYGETREDKYSNSYFGLGLMSILEPGKKAIIFSRAKLEEKVLKLEVDSEKIFSPELQDKPLTEINKRLKLASSDMAERERLSSLSSDEIKEMFGKFPTNFTEIIIENVDKKVFETINSDEFTEDLRKQLPLKPHKNALFLKSIKDPEAEIWLQELFANETFFPTIDVYLGKSGGEKEIVQLWKYFPDFKKDLEFGNVDIEYGEEESGDKRFAYYYLCSTDDLEERSKKNMETGFWVRNRNFLVKEADYFQKPGTRKKIIHEPLKHWLFGEIFHENMTDFLVVTRDEYVWESEQFRAFYNKINDLLYLLNEKLRNAWKNSNEVMKSVVNPFLEVGGKIDPFKRTFDVLQQMGAIKKEEDAEDILDKLHKKRITDLEMEDKRIDRLIEKDSENVILADDEKVKVVIDQEIESSKDFIKKREKETNRVILKISPKIFEPKKVDFLGRAFKVFYVAGKENQPGISVNKEKSSIFINPFNHDVWKFSISFIDVYIAIEIADILAKTKAEMKQYLVEMMCNSLTKDIIVPKKYLQPLQDDLQRRQW